MAKKHATHEDDPSEVEMEADPPPESPQEAPPAVPLAQQLETCVATLEHACKNNAPIAPATIATIKDIVRGLQEAGK